MNRADAEYQEGYNLGAKSCRYAILWDREHAKHVLEQLRSTTNDLSSNFNRGYLAGYRDILKDA